MANFMSLVILKKESQEIKLKRRKELVYLTCLFYVILTVN